MNKYETLFSLRNSELKEKIAVWKLIHNSYIGGQKYLDSGYLFKYPKESKKSFEVREKRSVYFNQLSPLVDMLSGLLFMNLPVRSGVEDLSSLVEEVSPGKKLNEFMRFLSGQSFLYTCGILVDFPFFDKEQVKTKQDEIGQRLEPYVVFYYPQNIRDFSFNPDDGKLDWVLLDDSYVDHGDPFLVQTKVERLTLWDRESYRVFARREGEKSIVLETEGTHPLGFVPFRFVSWRNEADQFVTETVCEDIAIISRQIYNSMSYLDEMLASGTFKMLAYPSKDGSVPDTLASGGVGPLGVLPFDMTSSNRPEFIGATLSDIGPFIQAMELYMAEILKKVGLSTDETKEFVKSGAAKKVDFQKMRALLVAGAQAMGKAEEWIFKTAASWKRLSEEKRKKIKVEYTSTFDIEDLTEEVSMLVSLLSLPVKSLKKSVMSLMVKKLIGNDVSSESLQEIYEEIEKSNPVLFTSEDDVYGGQRNRTVIDGIKKINKSSQREDKNAE